MPHGDGLHLVGGQRKALPLGDVKASILREVEGSMVTPEAVDGGVVGSSRLLGGGVGSQPDPGVAPGDPDLRHPSPPFPHADPSEERATSIDASAAAAFGLPLGELARLSLNSYLLLHFLVVSYVRDEREYLKNKGGRGRDQHSTDGVACSGHPRL